MAIRFVADAVVSPEDADGLLTLSAMKQVQKRDMAALKQRNEELEQTLQQANLLIIALNTMIETAEKELNVPIQKSLAASAFRFEPLYDFKISRVT